MGNYSYNRLKDSYTTAWDNMVVHPDVLPKAHAIADKIVSFKSRYLPLEEATGIPWYFIGLVHMRESNCDFETHLHNGDPLNVNGRAKRTTHVPKGMPKAPPQDGLTYTFEESAIDALRYQFGKVTNWGIEYVAYYSESYNGFGYRSKGVPSPYLWAGSNQYTRGKFIRDHVYDPTVVDSQLGVMVVLKLILDKTQPIPVVEPATPVPAPMSPAATVPRPSSADLRKSSRKFWLTEWAEQLLIWTTGGTTAGVVLDTANIQATRTYIDVLKSFAVSHGVYMLIGGLLAAFIVTRLLKIWMRQDVMEGRSTPSGEVQ